MNLQTITRASLIWILSVSSVGFGFQLPKSTPKLLAPDVVNHSGIVNKSKPAQFRTAVSSHVHFPKRKLIPHHPGVRRFGPSGVRHTHSVILAHNTSVTSNSGTVTLSVDLGKPTTSHSNIAVANAPKGLQFSKVSWHSLGRGMPAGVVLHSANGGAPEYPILHFTFAVPENAIGITPILKTRSSLPLGTIHFVPSTKIIKGKVQRVYDPNTYANPPITTISKPRTFRSLRMVTVSVPLVSTNGGEATALEQFTVGINFSIQSAPNAKISAARDPLFTTLNSHLVANTWDLTSFAVPLRHQTSEKSLAARSGVQKSLKFTSTLSSSDSIYNWIDTSAAYIRLAVTRDGLYRVNASDLNFQSLGFSLPTSGWNSGNLRCFNHGVEIPLWIDTDASGNITDIEFYGQHLRGFPLPTVGEPFIQFDSEAQRSEYYNVATDTNVYWLTSSSGIKAPLQFQAKSLTPSDSSLVSNGTILIHHEQDHNYYLGDANSDQTQTQEMTEYVAGERFEWVELHGLYDDSAASFFTDTFHIAQLPADTANMVASFKFLFRGMTHDPNYLGPNGTPHVVRAQINNGPPSLANVFYEYTYDSLKMTVPISQLVNGTNVVRINALTGGAHIDQFYLDYYELTYPSALAPSNDTGIAKGQWLFSVTQPSNKFQIGMSDASAHLYNLTDNTRILDPSGQYLDSTTSAQPEYAAATSSSLMKCDNIQPWNTGSPNVLSWQILSPRNQADYLVITNPAFETAAQRLATLQGSQGLKTKIVTTDEIFNAFDYGSNEPEAIRRYLNYAYFNYSGNPVGFVTLLGNASWDPKFNLAGSVQRSFVPSYGNPASDSYFTLPESDADLDSLPLMLIARIPVASEAAAENYLTKLNEYENEPPASWDKNFLFIAGGDSGSEHQEFDAFCREIFAPPLNAPPIDMRDTVLDRTDFSSGVDPTHIGEIENLLLTGQSIMYFAGHGATFTSDVAFPDASILQNKGLYPLLVTLTCRTGDFAEYDQIGVNQSYIQAPEAGSVQAYGTTGFGEGDYDDLLTENWINLMRSFDSTHDTTHAQSMNMLQLLTTAKMEASSVGFNGNASVSHNEALQNSMLGDAAVGFVLRPQAEFAVYPNGIDAYAPGDSLPQVTFTISDSFYTVEAEIYNYGYAANQPVVVRITDAGPVGFPISRYDTLPGLIDSASVSALFGLNTQSIGLHTITVAIDPDHRLPESYRPDDSASIQIQVNGLSTTNFFPYEGERQLCDISPSNVHFIVLTPAGSSPNDQVEIQLDTTQTFSNVFIDQKSMISSSYYVTFDIPMPATSIPQSSVYWWRTRVIHASGGDTTSWQYATFSTGAAPRSEFSYTSPQQLYSTNVNGLGLNSQGMLSLLLKDTMRLEAISHGINDVTLDKTFAPYAQVSLNGIQIWQDTEILSNGSVFDNGFAILVWSPDGTQIDSVYEFEMPWDSIGHQSFETPMAASFNSVLSAIPSGRRVMVLTVGSVQFQQYFFPATQALMESIGSDTGMFPMAYDGSYALIGAKGSPRGSAKESFAAQYSNGAMAFDTIITSGTSGLAVTPYTAVAKDYGALTWTGNPTDSGNNINFAVLGARRDGSGVDVVDNFKASAGNSFSLSNIDPRIYDRLAVQMGFIRTANSSQSPALSGIAIQYDPAPEFVFSPDSIRTVPGIVNTGGSVVADYSASTLTCTPADSVIVQLYRQYQSKIDTPVVHAPFSLVGRSTHNFSDSLQTQNELGTAKLTAIINPNEAQNEQLPFNNTISGSYAVARDTMTPTADILFLDPTDQIPQHLSGCGYISNRSTIKIQLLSSNPLRDTSSNSITAYFLDETNTSLAFPVAVGNTPNGIQASFQSFAGGQVQGQLTITPSPTFTFAAGTWLMDAYLRDASGNTDTIQQCFTVSDVNGIEEVMNYPNPFKETTDFTFILKSDASADIKIVVYTIAGRKIRTLTPSSTHAGFNAVQWDGRDERGNEVANGTYLYRVVINGTNGDNISDAITQTAVRAR